MVIETIQIFGSLCSIYSATTNYFKSKEYINSLALSIQALNSFKMTHTYAQKLREFCHYPVCQ
jgi:hypothetical protein